MATKFWRYQSLVSPDKYSKTFQVVNVLKNSKWISDYFPSGSFPSYYTASI